MRTVTDAFKEAQAGDGAAPIREVSYKRRYWDASTRTYVWEADWTAISESEVAGLSAITSKLDTDRVNEFKVSNVTLILKNELNQWRHDNEVGKFGRDSTSPLYPYEPFWTKFRVRVGFILADDTEEYVTVFTGYAVEFAFEDALPRVQITVQGPESRLLNANAEEVSTQVTEENMGTGNGATTEFDTDFNGVGIIDEVSVAGIKKRPGVDYTVSQLNDPDLPAKITFTAAPASGTIRCTYKYWQQDKKVEELIADLATEAGIDSGDQAIDPVFFANAISNLFTADTQGDWAAGTHTRTEGAVSPGDLKLDFGDTAHKQLLDDFDGVSLNAAWVVSGSASIVSNKVQILNSSNIARDQTRTTGAWQVDVQLSGSTGTFDFRFLYVDSNNYYAVRMIPTINIIHFVRVSGGVSTSLATSAWTADTSNHTFRVQRAPTGKMIVYFDGVSIFNLTDTTHASSASIMLLVGVGTLTATCNDLYVPADTLTGNFVSQVFDALLTPDAWGHLNAVQDLDGGTATYYTRSSTDGISWDAYVALSGTDVILSALKRYIQFKAEITAPSDNSDPTVNMVTMEYRNTTTLITLANFTGKTVYQAIQDLGKFANYEWGFTPDEEFFFRSKEVNTEIDQAIAREDQILDGGVSGMVNGYDKVYSEVVANYGDYNSKVRDDGAWPGSPIARFGTRRQNVDDGSILTSPDSNIADGVAAQAHTNNSARKTRGRVKTKFMPWVDLSDTLSVAYHNNQPVRPWFHGDSSVYLGQTDIHHYSERQMLMGGALFKVMGARHDYDAKTSEFELEEIANG